MYWFLLYSNIYYANKLKITGNIPRKFNSLGTLDMNIKNIKIKCVYNDIEVILVCDFKFKLSKKPSKKAPSKMHTFRGMVEINKFT